MKMSFYTPISYDFKYSLAAIVSYYKIADEIFLAIDKDRISWSKNKYSFDETFFDQIKIFDIDNKIKIIEENFHVLDVPIQNDTNERNFVTTYCKKGNFIIGVDSDEILLNPEEFFNWMSNQQDCNNDVSCSMSSVYKSFGTKLLINYPKESAQIGTNLINSYKNCRKTSRSSVMSPLNILHFSWGRTRENVLSKLLNFGHSKDFNVFEYIKIWDSVNLDNYLTKTNLHPLLKCRKHIWLKLDLLDISDFKLDKDIENKLVGILTQD